MPAFEQINLETKNTPYSSPSQIPRELYTDLNRHQKNQRRTSRMKQTQTPRIDRRKRIHNSMLSEKNNSVPTCLDSDVFIPNQESTNQIHSKLEGSFDLSNIPTIPYLLPTSTSCQYCNAQKFYRETKGFYCCDGKVKLLILDSPTELYDIFTSNEVTCMEFKKLSREYNNQFALTSFGAKYDKELFKLYKGIYTF